MKQKIFILIFLYLFFNLPKVFAKAVIVDMEDFLFQIDQSSSFSVFQSLVKDIADHYIMRFMEVLNTIDIGEKNPINVLYKQFSLPNITCKYHLDEISSEDAYKRAEVAVINNTSWFSIERRVLLIAASIMFNPEAEVKITKPVDKTFEILNKALRRSKNSKIILFSNKNSAVLKALKEKFPEQFKIFSNIFISGETKTLKPDKQAYSNVLKTCNLAPRDCLFIEMHEEYLKIAQELGTKVFLFRNENFDDVAKVIKAHLAEAV